MSFLARFFSEMLASKPSIPRRTIKVAVIGSGLAGLTAAYLLATARPESSYSYVEFEVHIFEKSSVLGMDAESLTVKVPAGSDKEKEVEVRVDVPMRSIQGGPYPRLMKLYERLGVALKQHDYSYSFSTFSSSSSGRPSIGTRMIYNGASGRAGVGLPSEVYTTQRLPSPLNALEILFNAIKWILAMLALVLHYARLYLLSNPSSRTPTHLCRETLRAWAIRTTQQNLISRLLGWEGFVANVIVPLFSAVCTTSMDDVWEHPAAEILDYIWLTFGTHHYVAAHGVQDIVSRLASPIPSRNIHLNAEVNALAVEPPTATEPSTTAEPSTAAEPSIASVTFGASHTQNPDVQTISGFSHIVLATPTRRSAQLLQSFESGLPQSSVLRAPFTQTVQKLNSFRTRNAVVITHRDDSVLPSHQSDWRDLNLVMETSQSPSRGEKAAGTVPLTPGCAMATHIFPTPSGAPLCQTTNPVIPPHPQTILSQSILDRSVLTVESKIARDSFCRVGSKGSDWIQGDLQGLKMSEGEKSQARVWLCGAWAYGGIPLLEGCVGSAEIVAQGILRAEGLEISSLI